MQVFLNDFSVLGERENYLWHIKLCILKCQEARLSLNPANCTVLVKGGMLLGHILGKEGIAMDPDKVKAIQEAPTPTNAKALRIFFGQI